MMPFCRECGKEIDNEWVSCPFCSAKLPQVQSENANDNFNQKVGKNLELSNGKPTGDRSSVFHNGKLIHLIASDDGYYYWADEEWHEINLEEDTIEESKDEVPIQQEAEERSSPSTFNPPSSRSSPLPPPLPPPPPSRSSPPPFNPPPPPLASGYPPPQSSKKHNLKKKKLKINLKKKKLKIKRQKDNEVKKSKFVKVAKHIISTLLGMGAFAYLTATKKECSEVMISGPRTIGNTGLETPAQYETYCIDVPAADIGTAIFCISLIIIIEVILPFLNWIKNRK